MRGAERQAETEAKTLAEAAELARTRFEEARATLVAEAGSWKKDFAAAMKTAETERQASVASLAESFKTDVAAISDNWEKERRKVLDAAKLERDALARDVRSLSDEVGRFRQELAQKTAQALDDFSRSYDGLSEDAARKTRESVADDERRHRGLPARSTSRSRTASTPPRPTMAGVAGRGAQEPREGLRRDGQAGQDLPGPDKAVRARRTSSARRCPKPWSR